MFLRCVSLLLLTGGLVCSPVFAQPRAEKPADATALKEHTWKVGNDTREALVYVPAEAKAGEKRPLIFAFHGHGGRAEYSARKFAFHKHWPEVVCVYPQGLPTAVPVIDPEGKRSGWQKYVGDQKDRDLEFFDAMLKTLLAEYKIDEQRIYAAGHSNGGYFTYLLCAARGDKFAAAAPVAATVSVRDFKNQKPLPLFHVAGEADRIVRYAGQERTMTQVRKLNGCDSEGKLAGKWCTEYRSEKGPPVVTFIHPGGHEIPDGAPEKIVEFFKGQKRKE